MILVSGKARNAAVGLGCWIAMLCAAPLVQAQEDVAATATELTALLRATQLQEWLGEPISMELGLCIQDELGPAWPKSAQGKLGERRHERLLDLRDQCGRASVEAQSGANLAATAPERGLLSSAKKDYLGRTARLVMLRTSIRTCGLDKSRSTLMTQCLKKLAGRDLSLTEQQQLLSLVEFDKRPAAAAP